MAKECYYFRHKLKQELYAYLEINEVREDSFFMTFKRSDVDPQTLLKGDKEANWDQLCELKRIAKMKYIEAAHDKTIEWHHLPVTNDKSKIEDKNYIYDPSLIYFVETHKQALGLD